MAVCGGLRASRGMIRALCQRRYQIWAGHSLDFLIPSSSGEFLHQTVPSPGKCAATSLLFHPFRPRFFASKPETRPQDYNVEAWTDTPYLEYIVGLEPEGSTPTTSTGGSTLAGVRGEKLRPHPGYTARLIRLRIENGASVKAREAILDEKSYMRDFGRFWIPMVADLMGGPHHHHSLEIFTWMKDHPTVLKSARAMELERLYSIMISYAGVVGRTMLARKWFDDMEQRGLRKSSQCCNAMIIAYAKDQDIESALQILQGMKRFSRECPPNAMTYYILISIFAKYHQWKGMEDALRECRDMGLALDRITYTTLMHAYAKMERLDRFGSTYEEMRRTCVKSDAPFEHDENTFVALLIGYSRLNALEKIEQIIDEMKTASVQLPKNIALPAVEEAVKAYSRNGTADNGLEKLIWYVEIDSAELTPSSAFQSYIVEAYAKAGKLDKIEEFMGRICDRKQEFIEPPAFETLVVSFVDSGELERVYGVYTKVKQAGFKLDVSGYEALVMGLTKGGCIEKMEEVYKDMEAPETKINPKVLRAMYDVYDKCGNVEKIKEISERIKDLPDEHEDVKVAAVC